jgi:hypothetical protein
MSLPLPFFSQYECRNETMEVFASDRRGIVEYKINNLGYRNNIDYSEADIDIGAYFGSSITTAIGVPLHNGFAHISATELNSKCYQFGQGCMMVDNQESLRLLKEVLSSNLNPKYIVLQFINLSRRYNHQNGRATMSDSSNDDIILFHQTFTEIEELLKNRVWCFIGTDNAGVDVGDHITKHTHCVTWNPKFIDFAGVGEHPGHKWHRMVAAGIVKNLQKQLF